MQTKKEININSNIIDYFLFIPPLLFSLFVLYECYFIYKVVNPIFVNSKLTFFKLHILDYPYIFSLFIRIFTIKGLFYENISDLENN